MSTRVYYPAGGAMLVNGVLYYALRDNLGSDPIVFKLNMIQPQSSFRYAYSPDGELHVFALNL